MKQSMFLDLPQELQRRIILMNKPSVMVRTTMVSRSTYSMGLKTLLLPRLLDGVWGNIDRQIDESPESRKEHNRIIQRHRANLSGYYGTHSFIVNAAYLSEKIARLIGDRAKFDQPDQILRRQKEMVNWKILGYLNMEDFEASMPSQTRRNIACTCLQYDAPGWL